MKNNLSHCFWHGSQLVLAHGQSFVLTMLRFQYNKQHSIHRFAVSVSLFGGLAHRYKERDISQFSLSVWTMLTSTREGSARLSYL